MKKQIFAIAAIVIVGSTALYSCKKEANATPETSTQASSVKRGGMTNMEHYGDEINATDVPHQPCSPLKKNCVILPDVVITGYDQLEAAVLEGPAGIASFFTSPESADLREYLGANITSMLQSGEYGMVLDYKDAHTMKYYVGKGQVSSGNFELALQIPIGE